MERGGFSVRRGWMNKMDGQEGVVLMDREDGWMERSGSSGWNKRKACRSVAWKLQNIKKSSKNNSNFMMHFMAINDV